jgi:hypothetical protein
VYGRGMNMTDRICEGCNEKYDHYPAGTYGGDWYSSCNICEWHSEGEGPSTIKQGLTLEELVAHKKKLNKLYKSLHCYAYTDYRSRGRHAPEDMMLELGNIMSELIDIEE